MKIDDKIREIVNSNYNKKEYNSDHEAFGALLEKIESLKRLVLPIDDLDYDDPYDDPYNMPKLISPGREPGIKTPRKILNKLIYIAAIAQKWCCQIIKKINVDIPEIENLVKKEVELAQKIHGNEFASSHEAFAVLLEEVEEVKNWVWKKADLRDHSLMIKELVQVSAVAQKWALQILKD